MSVATFIAGQLRRPSGLFGRFVVARILNRSNASMNELTLRALRLAPDDRVLEVGFGGGDLLDRLVRVIAAERIAGVDFSPEMVALCTKRFGGRIELHCAGVEALPYPEDAFTKACTVNTIYFWPDPRTALSEIRRTLRARGRVVVTFNTPATAGKLPYTKYGFTLYEPAEVRALLEAAGFRDVELVAGTSRLGEFFCATGTKEG